MVSVKIFLILVFALASHAYVKDLPARTLNILDRADPFGWTPAPTAAPGFDLVKRQAPPNPLCGYIEGNASYPLSCLNGYCGFQSQIGGFGCCSSAITENGQTSLTGCSGLATSCVGLYDPCDASCQSDSLVALCTKSAYPYCFEIQFAGERFSTFRCTDVFRSPTLTLEILSTIGSAGSGAGQGAVGSSTTDTTTTSEPISSTTGSSSSSPLPRSSTSSQGPVAPAPFTQTQQTVGAATTTQPAATATSSSSASGMKIGFDFVGLTLSLLGYWCF